MFRLFAGVYGQVDQAVRVPPLVIVPGDDLVEVVVEEDARAGVDGRGLLLADEIARNELVFGVSENALHLVFGGGLEGAEDIVLRGGLLRSEGQVDDGNVGGGDL